MRVLRRRLNQLAASFFVVLLIMSFDRTSAAAPPLSPVKTVDDPGVNSTAGSAMFVLSVAAVLVIGAIVTWKVRKNRRW
ncbi:MAG: hypothetical protein ACE37B_06665 [Ilumatobacter sp.]|uniref:hypothetical protein n=1 Tax=Ilumatobacter sp. TaxID=1967498 RepID=UPI00391BAA24